MNRFVRLALLLALIAPIPLAIIGGLWPRNHTPVHELRSLPEVAKVESKGSEGKLIVIHLRDWHTPGEKSIVDSVQREQMAIIRFLSKHGVKSVYSEGLSKQSLPDFDLRLKVAKDHPDDPFAQGLLLEAGSPARLLLAGEIDAVLPLEDQKALSEAKPEMQGEDAYWLL